jgi:hypothetical protein
MRHIELEPVWGGSADTAGTRRHVSAIALARQQEATNWLLNLIAQEHPHAEPHEALCRSAPSAATLERLIQLGRPCGDGRPEH